MFLKSGDHNTNVALWQGFLISLGYKLKADAHFGPATERATRSFQAANDLRADGIVGENTIAVARAKGFKGFAGEAPKTEPAAPAKKPVAIETKGLEKLELVHPDLKRKVTALINMAAEEGYTLRVVQGLRTFEEQDRLFRQWRDGKDNDGDGRVDEADERVTKAAGGQSNHNYGVAVDLAFVVDGKVSWDDELYPKLGPWAKACGLDWGGDWKFKDMPHVELPDCPNWRALLQLHKKGGIAAVWDLF